MQTMSNKNFGTGLLGIFLSLTVLTFFMYSSEQNLIDRIIASISEGFGGLAASMLLGLFVWGVIRGIRGASNSPEPKSFLLPFSGIFSAIYIVAKVTGFLSK
jgi:cell division protein FtsW (lipid II flippase)